MFYLYFPLLESWQQIKQASGQTSAATPTYVVAAFHTTPTAAKPVTPKPTVPIYPIKRFVRSQDSGRGGVEDELVRKPKQLTLK